MNAGEAYVRHLDRTLPTPAPAPQPEPEPEETVAALAVHRDPSLAPTATAVAEPDRSQSTLAWVRPSELPTLLGAPWVRRGIDLQVELARRARRTPRTVATKAGRAITRTAIARPQPSTPTSIPASSPPSATEGLGL